MRKDRARAVRPVTAWIVVVVIAILAMAMEATAAPRAAIAQEIRSPGLPLVGLFGLEAEGRRVVYVLDRSASMGSGEASPLAASKRELTRSLAALSEVQQFHLVFYNHRPRLFSPTGGPGRLVFATDENRREAESFVESIRADGGTNHAEAIRAAVRLGPDLVFMVTDGDGNDDLAAEDLDRLERFLGGTKLVIIQFAVANGGSPRLAELARRSGGESKTLDPVSQ